MSTTSGAIFFIVQQDYRQAYHARPSAVGFEYLREVQRKLECTSRSNQALQPRYGIVVLRIPPVAPT